MFARIKFREFFDNFKFQGPKNSFYGSLWWFLKIAQYYGHLPFEISSKGDETKVRVTWKSTMRYWTIFSFFALFAIYSHLTSKRHHERNKFAANVNSIQIIAVSITSIVGAINSFLRRRGYVEVKSISLSTKISH